MLPLPAPGKAHAHRQEEAAVKEERRAAEVRIRSHQVTEPHEEPHESAAGGALDVSVPFQATWKSGAVFNAELPAK